VTVDCLQTEEGTPISALDILSMLVALPAGVVLAVLLSWLRQRTIAALLAYTGWVFQQSSLTTKVSLLCTKSTYFDSLYRFVVFTFYSLLTSFIQSFSTAILHASNRFSVLCAHCPRLQAPVNSAKMHRGYC